MPITQTTIKDAIEQKLIQFVQENNNAVNSQFSIEELAEKYTITTQYSLEEAGAAALAVVQYIGDSQLTASLVQALNQGINFQSEHLFIASDAQKFIPSFNDALGNVAVKARLAYAYLVLTGANLHREINLWEHFSDGHLETFITHL